MADKILPQRIRELVPESQAYMDLLAFERKLDQTIMRKRVDIQEALKRPMKQKRKLRLYISNTFNPAKPDAEDSDGSIASWELRVEGKLLDDSLSLSHSPVSRRGSFLPSSRVWSLSWTKTFMAPTTTSLSGTGHLQPRRRMGSK